MRNLSEYPVTKDELQDYLNSLKQKCNTENIGNMELLYINELEKLLQYYK